MANKQFPYPLYLVISEKDCLHFSLIEVLEQAIKGGIDIVQLREKECSFEQYLEKAKAVKVICDSAGIPLIINDNVDVARAVNAWGVHVGTSDMAPSKISANGAINIGWSIESLKQLESSELKYVQHLGVSPVFSTPTKTNTIIEWGLEGIKTLKSKTDLPLIAIGGLNESTIPSVLKAGADSIAVVSAICASEDPFNATKTIKKLIYESK